MKEISLPKISCLTLTYGQLAHLKQCVQYYTAQTYKNKELVILSAGSKEYKNVLYKYVNDLKRSDIRLELLDYESNNLGMLRNITVELSLGEVICQWDDDDLYHPDRLLLQFKYMKSEGAHVCYLTDHLHWFQEEKKLYWTDWSKGNYINIVPPTLMMFKNKRFKYPETGMNSKTGEDTVFYEKLFLDRKIAKLKNKGYLSVYVYHGNNVSSLRKHKKIIETFPAVKPSTDMKRNLIDSLSHYNIPPPYKIVLGNDSLSVNRDESVSKENYLKSLYVKIKLALHG